MKRREFLKSIGIVAGAAVVAPSLAFNELAKEPKEELFLDMYPDAVSAKSYRKLSSSYSGPAFKVRRSSDNAEMDIHFKKNNFFDEQAFNEFVGDDDVYMVTWYDQLGNENHYTEDTAANQLRLDSSKPFDMPHKP